MKRGAPDHPKMRRLARRLGLPHMAAVGCMEMLWHWSARYAQDGAIGRYDDEDIADALYWTEPAERLITALVESGFVDRDEEHRLVLHGWSEHCEDSVHATLARARAHFADGNLPNLAKLGKEERPEAESFYAVEAPAKSGRQKSPPAAAGRQKSPALASASSLTPFEKKETREEQAPSEPVPAAPTRAPDRPQREVASPDPIAAVIDPYAPLDATHGDPERWARMFAREPCEPAERVAFVRDVLPQIEAAVIAAGTTPGTKAFSPAVRERLIAFWKQRSKPRDEPRVVLQRESFAEREERARQSSFEASVSALEAIRQQREQRETDRLARLAISARAN